MALDIRIDFVPENLIMSIVPLIYELNEGEISMKVLEERTREMAAQNWKCVGMWDKDRLIGICGLWFCTRHYSGRSMEADHVYIEPEYQGHGLGNKLFDWLHNYAKENGIEASELNTYVRNTRSHKFYYNLGYEILGFHFLRRFV